VSKEQETIVGRREFLNKSVMAAAGISCLGSWSKTIDAFTHDRPISSQSQAAVHKAAVHNMLILGTKTPFLYHLPMFSFPGFDSPHRYQVILEAGFSQQGKDLGDVFAAERTKHGASKIYTFSPEKFVLQDLAPQTRKEPLRQLSGTIFRGHLEKGGESIFKDVTARVRVVYFKEFILKATASTAKARPAPIGNLQYILFGAGSELFLAHLITKPPDFDQILPVTIPGQTFFLPSAEPSNEKLRSGVVISFPQISNTISRRLRPGLRVGSMSEKDQPIGRRLRATAVEDPGILELQAGKEIYLEEGELLVPPQFATTAAEKAAGFP